MNKLGDMMNKRLAALRPTRYTPPPPGRKSCEWPADVVHAMRLGYPPCAGCHKDDYGSDCPDSCEWLEDWRSGEWENKVYSLITGYFDRRDR